mgnify:CR=1 FL=1
MSVWSSYPFARITLCFGLGIILHRYFNPNFILASTTILMSSFYLLTLIFRKKYPAFLAICYGGIIISCCVLLGALRINLEKPIHQKQHILHSDIHSYQSFHMRIDGFPVEKPKHLIFQATILNALKTSNSDDSTSNKLTKISGKISLYISKDSLTDIPEYGDIIASLKKPFLLQAPKNPHEFDYSAYMARKGIHHQLFLSEEEFKIVANIPANRLIALSHKTRLFFKNSLFKFIPNKSSRDIALALILGIKDDLEKDLKVAYSSAGAMHVLAVSGLHVGIIHMLLSWALGFLKKYRFGRALFLVNALFFLWCYAFVTGLSPSVLRAVIMFSVVIIGNNTLRFHNVYNSLSASAFFILLYNPFMLMEVGFQLSYSAVLGIVYLQPKIYNLFKVKNYFLDKAWSITCVSLAAQTATFPIGLYYFHQFPTYFLASNLIVIPAAFGILLNGLAVLIFSLFSDTISIWLGKLLDLMIYLLNKAVLFINELPLSLIDWIRLDSSQLVMIYIIMLSLILLFKQKTASYLKTSFIACLAFMLITGQQLVSAKQSEQLVYYEIRNNNAIDFIENGHVNTFLFNTAVDDELINYQIGPNRLANSLPKFHRNQLISGTKIKNLGEVIFWKKYKILIVNQSISKLSISSIIDTDFLILSGNHFVDLKKLKSNFNFKHLIIDSTYKKYRSKGLSNSLKKENIPHWNINEDGAFIFDVK